MHNCVFFFDQLGIDCRIEPPVFLKYGEALIESSKET